MPFDHKHLAIDVFNGDADGICALHQLRMHAPDPNARLVTGVKRDINLLARLGDVAKATITVLDISLDKNRDDVERLLTRNNKIFYVDHHFAGDIPQSANLQTHIDPSPQTCTSLIIDALLGGKYRAWAVVGAFGDNLDETAIKMTAPLGLKPHEVEILREIGVLLNYNGYGATLADLYFSPDTLYQHVKGFNNPLEFHTYSPALATLRQGYADDMALAEQFEPIQEDAHGRIVQFPETPWSRRVSGVFANKMSRQYPDKAQCLLTTNKDGSLCISVRAPLNNRTGADELCRQFPTGGGRAAAAGVNHLPAARLADFIEAFTVHFSRSTSE